MRDWFGASKTMQGSAAWEAVCSAAGALADKRSSIHGHCTTSATQQQPTMPCLLHSPLPLSRTCSVASTLQVKWRAPGTTTSTSTSSTENSCAAASRGACRVEKGSGWGRQIAGPMSSSSAAKNVFGGGSGTAASQPQATSPAHLHELQRDQQGVARPADQRTAQHAAGHLCTS